MRPGRLAPPPSTAPRVTRRLPIGAEPVGTVGTHFRVWAPKARSVAVVLVHEGDTDRAKPRLVVPPARLTDPEANGYFSGTVEAARPGSRYWLQIDEGDRLPDPASRFQPAGPHGPSEVVDPTFSWQDTSWTGAVPPGAVAYELHVGTFTARGTYAAAMRDLTALAGLGVSIVELMPLAEFPGRFGWGYDGVLPFAPSHLYGRPADLRAFVDRAHSLGLSVILDVVYNHLGPDGNYLGAFSDSYFTARSTEWGDGFNVDGPDSAPVREYLRANARYWITEFHLDGLRIDATQAIADRSPRHIIADLTDEVRAATRRRTWIVGENEPQDVSLLRPTGAGGGGLDALWNDDFHHTARVALTGGRDGYYRDYLGSPQEFISAARHGFLYQGQRYAWQKKNRGTSTADISNRRFVCFLDNHDQVANSRSGARVSALTSPGKARALTTLLLLGPWTPMLFQGEECAASAPFYYFADYGEPLASAIRAGRRSLLAQFQAWKSMTPTDVPDPGDERTFLACKLDPTERTSHRTAVDLHRSLIALRLTDPAFHDDRFAVDGAVLTPQAWVLRFTRDLASAPTADRLLVVNLGADTRLAAVPEPLLAPPAGTAWRTIWSSDAAAYGGPGLTHLVDDQGWRLPAESATVLGPEPL